MKRAIPYREEWIIAARYWMVMAAVNRHAADRLGSIAALEKAHLCFRHAKDALPRATVVAVFGPILRPLEGPIQ